MARIAFGVMIASIIKQRIFPVRVAIPLFGTRIAPRCLYAESMILASIENGSISSRSIHHTRGLSNAEWIDLLVELGIEVVVCGAAPKEFQEGANALGITIITNVAGEAEDVLEHLVEGNLLPGYGLGMQKLEPAVPDEVRLEAIDCVRCIERECLHGGKCVPGLEVLMPPEDEGELRRILEVATDIALEKDRKLCRVAELVHYGIGMGYKHLGVAFCVEMFREAEILVGVLRRFFKVSPVCCKVGGVSGDESDLPPGPADVVCNVTGQAKLLNIRKTELNVIAGLCVGCDTVFAKHSEAPVTTLFVKDKSLANNPVGALYSKYYLEDLAHEI